MFASDILQRRRDSWARSLATLAAILVTVSGCASSRPVIDLPELSSWERRQEVLSKLSSWEFKGRIAIKAGDEGFNGKFRWTQTGDEFSATVGGPLGVGTVRIEGDDQTIVLTDKDGVETLLVDPEIELYYRYGWTIPVSSLRYWALGIPDPDRAATTALDDDGRLASLEQGNWQVTISRYKESAGQSLPHTLTAINPDTRVRMVIDTWSFFD
ncbi:MAG: lipoprotein insertase outer membrane protein LolB [Gammaproteobacteria bacterium]|nr:lipoprotein insertase outer membrane protein LolB [Gammaproteobacteria bacterium]MDH5583363.1 lipoprotein insertase outer membrane protein LolB [Gammaproteobacteria bacterium]